MKSFPKSKRRKKSQNKTFQYSHTNQHNCSTTIPICNNSKLPSKSVVTLFSFKNDIHEQLDDMIKIFEKSGDPQHQQYLFLGDYVDRRKQSIKTIILLLAYKLKHPKRFFILIGNHQCARINKIY